MTTLTPVTDIQPYRERRAFYAAADAALARSEAEVDADFARRRQDASRLNRPRLVLVKSAR